MAASKAFVIGLRQRLAVFRLRHSSSEGRQAKRRDQDQDGPA